MRTIAFRDSLWQSIRARCEIEPRPRTNRREYKSRTSVDMTVEQCNNEPRGRDKPAADRGKRRRTMDEARYRFRRANYYSIHLDYQNARAEHIRDSHLDKWHRCGWRRCNKEPGFPIVIFDSDRRLSLDRPTRKFTPHKNLFLLRFYFDCF